MTKATTVVRGSPHDHGVKETKELMRKGERKEEITIREGADGVKDDKRS
jgi:hypothetical protein